MDAQYSALFTLNLALTGVCPIPNYATNRSSTFIKNNYKFLFVALSNNNQRSIKLHVHLFIASVIHY